MRQRISFVVGQRINGKTLSDSGSELQSKLLKLYKEVETKKGTLMKSIEGTRFTSTMDQGKAVPGSGALCPAIKGTS